MAKLPSKAGAVLFCVMQDGAAAVAPAESLSSGLEGASAAGPAGRQRKLHSPDRHLAGLQTGPASGNTETLPQILIFHVVVFL